MIVAILLPDFILYRGLFVDCSRRGGGHGQCCPDTAQPRGPSEL